MSDAPWWLAAGSAAFMAVLATLFITRFRRLLRRWREHPEQRDEPWDPFA